ncbi:MAG: hypothetical protein ACXADW_14970 [Candidatus Hodarchaeales archaeon]|jgi:hypothetical protein
MEIEYQKNEVTWCLDRDGPRICLRAVSINDELQHLEISSEAFNLDLKTTEAQEFLSIIKNLAASKRPSIPLTETISPDIVKKISDEIFQDEIEEIPTIASSHYTDTVKSTPSFDTTEILETLQKPDLTIEKEVVETPVVTPPLSESPESLDTSPTLDTSEILDVLKQSEVQEEEEPAKIRRLRSLFKAEETVSLTPSTNIVDKPEIFKRSDGELENEITQLTDILIGKEEPEIETYEPPTIQSEPEDTIEGILQEENVKPSVVLGERVDTASFFQKTEEKSPLEQLLDENEEEDESISSFPTVSTEEPSKEQGHRFDSNDLELSEEVAHFSPDDLQSSSFISDLNSKIEDNKTEIDTEEIQDNRILSTEDDSRKLKPINDGSYTTEADRRKQIEKEREARKKRLWELTRGF